MSTAAKVGLAALGATSLLGSGGIGAVVANYMRQPSAPVVSPADEPIGWELQLVEPE